MLDIGFLKALGADLPNRIAPAIGEASSQTVLLQFQARKMWTGATRCQISFPELVWH
jgi:hypothetical protein